MASLPFTRCDLGFDENCEDSDTGAETVEGFR